MKWMAYESLSDGIFSEKTDVVSLVYWTVTHNQDIEYLTEITPQDVK